jgi:hypothetical protein
MKDLPAVIAERIFDSKDLAHGRGAIATKVRIAYAVISLD